MLAASLGGGGLKSSLDDDDGDFALTLLGGKKEIYGLSPPVSWIPSLLSPHFFLSTHCVFDCLSSGLIGFFHAMQFC